MHRYLAGGTTDALMIGKRSRRALSASSTEGVQKGMEQSGNTNPPKEWMRADPELETQISGSSNGGNSSWSHRQLSQSSSSFNVLVWDLTSPGQVTTLLAHTGSVTSTAFSPSGLQLASGSSDGTVRIWSVPAFRQVGVEAKGP